MNCNNNPNCCLVSNGGNSMTTCLNSSATIIRATTNATIFSGQSLANRSLCIKNSIIDIDPGTTVNNNTCIEANGGNGVSVTVGGTTYDFRANDMTLDALNAAFAALGGSGTIGSVAVSLPVTLKSFSASPLDGRQIMIEWTTSVESDNDYFLLEHSTDGKTFQRLRTIDSYGNSETEQKYSYLHQVASGGDQYYRLSQYDLDGSFASLGLTQVKLVSDGQIPRLYPNPISAGQEIRLSGVDQFENTSCTLHNMIGQSWPLQNTGERLQLPANLPAGKYFLRVISGSIATSIPLQIQ